MNNQLVFLPNGQRIIYAFIIQAGYLLDTVIINNEINFSDIPAVQLLVLLLEHDDCFEQLKKLKMIQPVVNAKPPPPEKLLDSTIDEPLDWYQVVNLIKTPMQTDASYGEQQSAIKVCVE